jgi:non-specific serine/threonine protein kinase
VVDLQGLDYPPVGTLAGEALRFPAVQLLTARAGEVGAHLDPLEDSSGPLAEIARLLDGVPLALELAASRLRFISPTDLPRQLTTHITLLASDRRDLPDRQRTLEAAIDWSFRLLEDDERALLTRLAVFRGGFSLDAAQQVCGWDLPDPSAALEALAGHSLVTIAPQPGASHRYQLLWVIRLFAQSRLGDDTNVLHRHADYYLGLVEPPDPAPLHPPFRAMTELLAESENLRAALRFYQETGEGESGLRLAAALAPFWLRAGALSEGQTWLSRFLADTPGAPPSLKVRALLALADAYDPTSSDLALATAQRALGEARETGDPYLVATASALLGRTHALRYEREAAKPLIEDALRFFEGTNDNIRLAQCHEALGVVYRGMPEDVGHYRKAVDLYRAGAAEVDLAQTLFSMAYRSLIPRGDFEEAHAAIDESAALAKKVGSPQVHVHARTGLGQLRRLEGRLDEATEILAESLEAMREFGDRRCTVRMLTALSRIDLIHHHLDRAMGRLSEAVVVGTELDRGLSSDTHELVDALGLLALARGEHTTAARWLGAAEAIRTSQALLRPPPDQAVIDDALGQLVQELGQERVRRLLDEGSGLSLEDLAVELTGLGSPVG